MPHYLKTIEVKDFWNIRLLMRSLRIWLSPNIFLKNKLDLLPRGSILLLPKVRVENAIYALNEGWEVTAFDFSESACARQKH